jgi:plastocyanin
MAQFGAPPTLHEAAPPVLNNAHEVGVAPPTGKVWDVVVAPQQGVLRFMPFAVVGAAPGDVIRYTWRASPHTVTKATALNICNATLDAPFASGRQDAGFVFEETISSTQPIWFFCGVGDHCAKGMFGVM